MNGIVVVILALCAVTMAAPADWRYSNRHGHHGNHFVHGYGYGDENRDGVPDVFDANHDGKVDYHPYGHHTHGHHANSYGHHANSYGHLAHGHHAHGHHAHGNYAHGHVAHHSTSYGHHGHHNSNHHHY